MSIKNTCIALALLACAAVAPVHAQSDGTVLGNLAASMQPGTWAELQSTGAHAAFSADESIFEYADRMVWDSIGKQALFYGSSDPGGSANHRFVRYQASTNAWTVLPNPPWAGSQNIAHSYKHNVVDVAGRRLYYRVMGSDNREFWSASLDNPGGGWTRRADISAINYVQDASALDYFGARSRVVLHSGDINGSASGLVEYNPANNQWSTLGGQYSPRGGLHAILECNAVHRVCIFGGGDNTSNLWKLNPDGSVVSIASAPFSDFSTRFCETTVDPLSGDFLVFTRDNRLYRFDVTDGAAGRWTQVASGSSVPPFNGYTSNDSTFHMVAVTIDTYGVIMVPQWRSSGTKVFIYKHSAGTRDSLPPAAPANLRSE
jgi:hypothetical protein